MSRYFVLAILALFTPTVSAADAPKPDLADQLLHLPAPARPGGPETRPSIPDDNASVDALVDYWIGSPFGSPFGSEEGPRPSGKLSDVVREKLLQGVLKDPIYLPKLLDDLPQTPQAADAVKGVYDKLAPLPETTEDWTRDVRGWLTFHTQYFREDLIAAARQVKPDPPGPWITNDLALKTLAKLDWPAADPLLAGYQKSDNPQIVALAMTIRYEHAIEVKDAADRDTAGAALERIARDANQPLPARDLAVQELFSSRWAACDNLLAALVAESDRWLPIDRHDPFGGGPQVPASALVEYVKSNPDHSIALFSKLLASPDPKVQWSAADGLLLFQRADALKPILPLLEHQKDLDEQHATAVVMDLADIDLPQSLPLLHQLFVSQKANPAWLARAIVRQNGPDANAALRIAIDGVGGNDITQMLIDRGGLSPKEIANSIETHATELNESETPKWVSGLFGNNQSKTDDDAPPPDPSKDAFRHGREFSNLAAGKPGVAPLLLDRAKTLRPAKTGVARQIWKLIAPWPDVIIDREFAARLAGEPLDADLLDLAVQRCASLRKNESPALKQLLAAGGLRGGLAAAVLGDPPNVLPILKGTDLEAIRMLLASARLMRTPLPLDAVQHLFDRRNAQISTAAEQYLIVEDSPEARQSVLARHPGQALILGAGWEQFADDEYFDHTFENELRAQVLKPDGPTEIFAMDGSYEDTRVIVRGDGVTVDSQPIPGKHCLRRLSNEEWNQFKDFIARFQIDDLPNIDMPVVDGYHYNYLHVTPAGGRRMHLCNPGEIDTANTPYFHLVKLFERLENRGTFKTRYTLQDTFPAARVLWSSNPAQHLRAVWKDKNDLRVFVTPTDDAEWENTTPARGDWHALRNGNIAEIVPAPPGGVFHTEHYDDSPLDSNIYDTGQSGWRHGIVGDTLIHAGDPNHDASAGIWRIRRDQPPVRIVAGPYVNPIATPDGKWAIVSSEGLSRLDLITGKIDPIPLPPGKDYTAVCYLPFWNQILVTASTRADQHPEEDYFLIDPATGSSKSINGDLKPIIDNQNRPMYPSKNPDEFWMALSPDSSENQTSLVLYNVRSFQRVIDTNLPEVHFTSDAMWIDVEENVAYVAVNGDLLKLPLPISVK